MRLQRLWMIAALAFAAACGGPEAVDPPSLTGESALEARPGDRPGAPRLDPVALMISSNTARRERALEPVFQPREDLPEWRFSLPLNWGADPFNDNNWRFQLHAWRMVNPLVEQDARGADAAHFQRAVAIARDWKRWHETRTADLSWQDMATGLRASALAYLIREIRAGRGEVSEEAWRDLVLLARAHGEILSRPGFILDDNHGIYAAHGLMALCQTLPELRECEAGLDLAAERMDALFAQQFSGDGVHVEHSPDYHWFAMTVFDRVASTGWYAGTGFQAGLARAHDAAPFLLHADARQPGVGDSPRTAREDDAARVPDVSQACGPGAEDCALVRHFAETGYAITRSPRGSIAPHSLFFTCAWHSPAHKHADELSIEWWGLGGLILAESGKYAYTPDRTREFVLSRPAHNTVSFAGRTRTDHPQTFPGACTDEPRVEDETIVLSGAYDPPGAPSRHAREIAYRPNESLVVTDRVEHARGFTQWFHFAERVEVSQTGEPHRFRADLEDNNGQIAITTEPGCRARLHHGERRPMQGWISTGYGQMSPRWSLEIACPSSLSAAEARFEIVR